MGLFWDLLQQSQISDQRNRAASLEQRLDQLERELDETRRIMRVLVERLEAHFGEDLNADGRVGA